MTNVKKVLTVLFSLLLVISIADITFARGGHGPGNRGPGGPGCGPGGPGMFGPGPHGPNGPGGPGMGMWWQIPELVEKMNISQGTLDKIQTIMNTHRNSMIDLRADLEKKQLELANVLSDNSFDKNKALKIAEQLADQMSQLHLEQWTTRINIMSLLTPEQRNILKAEFQNFRAGNCWWQNR